MPLGMETDPLSPLFRALGHLKAKALGAQLLALFLAGLQPERNWSMGCFPSWPLPPTGVGEKRARCLALFTQGLFDFLGRFWGYFPSHADHRGDMGPGTQFWPQSHYPPEKNPQTLGDKKTLGHERPSRGGLHRLKTGRHSWSSGSHL